MPSATAASPRSTSKASSERWRRRCARWTTCWTSPTGRCRSSRKKRAPSAASASASRGLGDTLVMMRLRYDREEGRQLAAQIAERMRDAAYAASVDLALEKGAFPKFEAEPYLERRHLRQPPAAGAEGPHPRARPAQQPPAVDRAHRHRQPGLRRQRLQRHRAGLLLDLPAQEARGRRQPHRVRSHGPRLAPVRLAGRRHGQAAGVLRLGAGDGRRLAPGHDGRGAALRRHGDLQDGERRGGLSLRRLQGPVPPGLGVAAEGTGHLPAQHHPGRGAGDRRRPPPRSRKHPRSTRCAP